MGFYRGDIAQKLVSSVQANGGVWSLQDLIQYQIVERDPVRFRFASADFVTASLPSSGGVVLASIFNMLDALNYQQADDTQKIHLLVEAMRRAYRDRAAYLGDVDYIDIPLQKLASKAYAMAQVQGILPDKASRSADIGKVGEETGGNDTTHFSIIDQHGNMVAATLSVNYPRPDAAPRGGADRDAGGSSPGGSTSGGHRAPRRQAWQHPHRSRR